MNLLDIRKWLIKESGRYELVLDVNSWSDNGANNYINAGQFMLDDMQETTHGPGINMQQLAAGASHILFGYCRAIQEVFCINPADDSKWKLKLREYPRYHDLIHKSTYPETAVGPPVYYFPSNFRLAPESEMISEDINVPTNYMQFVESPYLYNGMFINPVADSDYVIETHGLFYTPQLMQDTDSNYWSERYPHILVMAAQCIMEMFMRNTEGVNDWVASIRKLLDGIDYNLANEQLATNNRLRG